MELPQNMHLTHQEWQSNIRSLRRVVGRENNDVSQNNLIIHFFMCAIRLEYNNEYRFFKDVSERIIRASTEVQMLDPRVSAATAVKHVLSTESFPSDMLSRISAEDVRNAIVCEMWKKHAIVVPTDLHGPPPKFPRHVVRRMKSVETTANDNTLLLNLMKWINLSRRVICVRGVVLDGSRKLDDPVLDTCTGVWWKSINTRGLSRTVWDIVLDIAQYSSNTVTDESI